ncbi:zinc metalloprotease [Aquimarina intermedia]|uniref:zinc metalloprotease n=1 Tax=Aquimarina intermedia TaxID=350814 RepID=UPI0029394F68|nr:zinc metalloprotease [Aquimarina intermedia]
MPNEFSNLTADVDVQFTLKQVTRKQSNRRSWGTRDRMKRSSRGGVDAIDTSRNLNIWICNIGGGILGYAQFPGGSASTDGVVISPQYFGTQGYVSAPFDKGRTATHEVGHWLNLRHIWGDGGCSVDDYVSDTPVSSTPNYGCPSYPTQHCNSNDMTMNYMDYVDDSCMYMFTTGQKNRMRALFASGGYRSAFAQ